jgi:hypothetical protein
MYTHQEHEDLDYRDTAGTSPATANSSGLAAYLFAQADRNTGAQIMQKMIRLVWERKKGAEYSPKTIYSGIKVPKSGACSIQKRGMEARAEEECFSEGGNSTISATERRRSHARSFEIPDFDI